MKLFAVFPLAAGLLFLASSAHAEGATDEEGRRARLAASVGVMSSHDKENSVIRNRFTLSPEFAFGGRLIVAPLIRLNSTMIGLRESNGLPFNLSLALPWQPTLGARADYRLFDVWRLSFNLRGEFESPLGENQARIESYVPKRMLVQVPIDIDLLRSHVQIDHLWRSASGSLMISARIGRFRPFVELGYMVIDSSLMVTFDKQTSSLLASAKVHPNRFLNNGISSPFYMAGLHVDLGRGFQLRLGGALFAYDDMRFLAAEGTLAIPIGIPGF